MLTQIINGLILTPQGWVKNGSVIMEGSKILEIDNNNLKIDGAVIVDAHGNYILPGGIELHVHGGGGRDFMEGTEEAFNTAIQAHLKHGTTCVYPTLASSSIPMIEKACATVTEMMKAPDTPILGLHLEGPYLNPVEAGGQIPENIILPNPEVYKPLIENWPCVKRCDAAPEREGALDFGKYAAGKDILVSIAHTTAEYNDVLAAWNSGYTHATHFYNGMKGFHKGEGGYKHEGTVESVYLIDNMTVEVIADGKHLPPAILKLIYKMKGVEKMCLITDALAPAASESTHAFDPRVIIEDGVCKLADRSALTGSIATMDRLIRTVATETNILLEDVVRMASETPAKIMGVYDRKGSLQKGKDADILILDNKLQVAGVWQMGHLVEGTCHI
ncbi:MAG: N-acetylglucosamine-6-phosphate deacetylase [Phocaeicola sp.]|uniref:N-acetylglucosamine-6-phosphate deacetylase n=1 Tax=Phocaeicola TaxID=909656 RepID=UPI00234E45C7|nr:N-acetylglucosamine-6-phosphate deacetylase [Phocaeicola oris]MCE2615794.1 N-acetylglucosamine-6-phosphate deacetylase [Phocaeicola oris]